MGVSPASRPLRLAGSRNSSRRARPFGPSPATTFPGVGARSVRLGQDRRSRISITSGGRVGVRSRSRAGVWHHPICRMGVTGSTLASGKIAQDLGPHTDAGLIRAPAVGAGAYRQGRGRV